MSIEHKSTIAVIGGSGLYEMDGLTDVDTVDVDTPFGKPSDLITVGELEGVKVADRKSVVQEKSVDLGGRRIIKKKK